MTEHHFSNQDYSPQLPLIPNGSSYFASGWHFGEGHDLRRKTLAQTCHRSSKTSPLCVRIAFWRGTLSIHLCVLQDTAIIECLRCHLPTIIFTAQLCR